MSVPTPVWSRPDDAVRQAQLDAMKRRATGLLALAAAIFGAAAALETRYPWLGYVRATAEASLVGGLADWFAVTALFRPPLGKTLSLVLAGDAHQDLLSEAVRLAAQAVHDTGRRFVVRSVPKARGGS